MSPSRRMWTGVFAGLVVVTVAVVAWLWPHAPRRTPPRAPDDFVPVTWQQARTTPGHAVHVDGARLDCKECHEGFAESPGTKPCGKCHESESTYVHTKGVGAATSCLTCHAFGQRPATECRQCHGGQQGSIGPLADHAGANVACNACHGIHGQPHVVLATCTTCHRGVGAEHGLFAALAPDPSFGADKVASFLGDGGARSLEGFREAGAPAAPFVVAREGPAPVDVAPMSPANALPGQVCTQCHAPHAGKAAARSACAACHVQSVRVRTASPHAAPPVSRPGPGLAALAGVAPAVQPRGKDVAGHPACVTCHEPHRMQKAKALPCEGCHEDRRTTAAVRAHAPCTACHAPHAPGEADHSCTKCHAGMSAMGAPKITQHASCASCHDPHRPEVSPTAACARCHAEVHPTHPAAKSRPGGAPLLGARVAKEQASGNCIGCHDPHPKAPAPRAAACSACHHEAKNDHAFHGRTGALGCDKCHAPHAFDLASLGTALCARCHQPMVTAVAARAGHADCRACHGAPHAPVAKPACAACHAQEVATAPKGHSACTNCHDAHSGSLGAHRACTSCHAEKGGALHGAIAGGCAKCHRPHGPAGVARPPACTTCHEAAKLPGLHSVQAHAARCDQCHGPHAPPKSDRATCTGTCHAKQRTHQPEAQLCQGCHGFRK